MENEEHDYDLPILSDVVEAGNESIIQSSRSGREVQRELDVLQNSEPMRFVLNDAYTGDDDESKDEPERELIEPESQFSHKIDDSCDQDEAIELMIDVVVDRHITELRKDIKRLLIRAKQFP